jgi:hypothetical protein
MTQALLKSETTPDTRENHCIGLLSLPRVPLNRVTYGPESTTQSVYIRFNMLVWI